MNALNSCKALLAVVMRAMAWLPAFAAEPTADDMKFDSSYIWAEASDMDKTMAYQKAMAELLIEVNDARAASGMKSLTESDILSHTTEIVEKSTTRTYSLIYIPRAKALSLTPKKSASKSAATRPKAVKTAPAATAEAPRTTKTRTTPKPATEVKPAASSDELPACVRTLMKIPMATDALDFIADFKSKGAVSEHGVARSLEEIPDEAYCLIFDSTYTVKAILSPSVSGSRRNCHSGNADTVASYHGCGVVWFKL